MRILLVDDHEIVRRGLRNLLVEEFPQAVFGEADTVPQARALIVQQEWNLVLLDINLPGGSGLELLAELRRSRPQAAADISGRANTASGGATAPTPSSLIAAMCSATSKAGRCA